MTDLKPNKPAERLVSSTLCRQFESETQQERLEEIMELMGEVNGAGFQLELDALNFSLKAIPLEVQLCFSGTPGTYEAVDIHVVPPDQKNSCRVHADDLINAQLLPEALKKSWVLKVECEG